jgi:hypothetical protein
MHRYCRIAHIEEGGGGWEEKSLSEVVAAILNAVS